MSNFKVFKQAVNKNMERMMDSPLFTVEVSKEELKQTYLSSFPRGTNPIYRENTEHDCSCCKSFIYNAGPIVEIVNGELKTIWDITVEEPYQTVANAMAKLIKTKAINNVLKHYQANLGTDYTHELLPNGESKKWEHFHFQLPQRFFQKNTINRNSYLNDTYTNYSVLKQSLEEISLDALNTVIELIDQNSLYRGQEHKTKVTDFKKVKEEYEKYTGNKELFFWSKSIELKHNGRIRTTVIGSLLLDLAKGRDLESSVKSFEDKVAPTNYKRPTALITGSMIKEAEKKCIELGIQNALQRRFAVLEDITINNVIYADRSTQKALGVFDSLKRETDAKIPKLDKVQTLHITDFLRDVVPSAESIEIGFEGKHKNNLVSLIAPTDPSAKNILKWGNNFSWSYNGEVTDSITELVKKAGGNVTGEVRASLAWFNSDDLDLSITTPSRQNIYYSHRVDTETGGQLDVDMNAGGKTNSVNPVENITWLKQNQLIEGDYKVVVNNFSKRNTSNVGFTLEFHVLDKTYTYHYPKGLSHKESINVLTFNYSKKNGIVIIDSLKESSAKEEIWGINTTEFHRVDSIMYSPNHWDNDEVGNKHYFFMLKGCVNPDPARGFYNEFLKPQLNPHRKVFEVLSSKLKTPESNTQLSGVGFSSTKTDSVLVKVHGSFERILKVTF